MLDVGEVRRLAAREGWTEVQFNQRSAVLGFKRQDQRVNVYYTTGTVGTCLDHPRAGKTQLFRRNRTLADLAKIFKNPRQHSGARAECSMHPPPLPPPPLPPPALRSSSGAVLPPRPLPPALPARSGAGYYRRHSWQRAEPSQAGRLRLWCCLRSGALTDQLCDGWRDEVETLALGSGYFVVERDGQTWWADVPTALHNKVVGRQKSLPPVDYVALGGGGRWFVQFTDGNWWLVGPQSLHSALCGSDSAVEILAFAPDDGWCAGAGGPSSRGLALGRTHARGGRRPACARPCPCAAPLPCPASRRTKHA